MNTIQLLPEVFKELAGEFPLLRPSVRMVPFPSLLGLVENQKLHATFGTKEGQKKSSLYFRRLCSAPIACVCSPEQQYFAENIESAFTLVKARLGYTLYTDVPQMRGPGLCYIPVTDLPSLPFGVYYRYDNDHPVLKRFLSLCGKCEFVCGTAYA